MDATNGVAAYDMAVEFAERRIRKIVSQFVAGLRCPGTCPELEYDAKDLELDVSRVWGGPSPTLANHYRIVIQVVYRFSVSCSEEAAPQPDEEEELPTEEGAEEGSAPGGGSIPPSGQPGPGSRPCTREEEEAELQRMLGFYRDAVNNARATGYQAANDPGYSDPGLGFHRVGNCADWQQVSWSALVTRTWRCWKVEQIRARRYWSLFTFHHFVRLEAKTSGRVVYLDPWRSGNPDHWDAADFPFPDGNGWAHTVTHTHDAGDPPRDPGND